MLTALSEKLHWHARRWLLRNLWLLNLTGGRLTVIDHFGTPGDTLMTATICRILKQRYPKLEINCITRNPDLLEHDPAIDELNGPVGFCHLSFEYLGLVDSKADRTNVLAPTLATVGITNYTYKAKVYLTSPERAQAALRVSTDRPIISINVMSKELVKVWPLDRWSKLVRQLQAEFTLIQLGDDKEPSFPGVLSFGGKLTKRESMAMISLAAVHIGPDSFLMHAANGLDVPSVIIYGGSRPAACLGYAGNENMYVQIACSPCWLHTTKGELCPFDLLCMKMITVEDVLGAVKRIHPDAAARKASVPASPSN